MSDENAACENTDREIWRGPDEGGGDFYADSLHITKQGGLGINCGGSVYVKPIREWHRLAGGPITAPQALAATPAETQELADEIERSTGLLRMVPGLGEMQLGIKKTAMVIAALRAVPASPAPAVGGEWRSGVPTKPRSLEWFIAETTLGHRVCLVALPDDWTYDFKTADDTYINADKIKRWMQFPDSEYIAPAARTASPLRGREALHDLVDAIECELDIEYRSFAFRNRFAAAKAALAPPASPLRGRDREQIAAVLYMTRFPHLTWISAGPTETAFAYKQADAILPLFASPPEQPAAVTGPDNTLRAYSVEQLQFELAIRATWKSPPSKEPELPAAQS